MFALTFSLSFSLMLSLSCSQLAFHYSQELLDPLILPMPEVLWWQTHVDGGWSENVPGVSPSKHLTPRCLVSLDCLSRGMSNVWPFQQHKRQSFEQENWKSCCQVFHIYFKVDSSSVSTIRLPFLFYQSNQFIPEPQVMVRQYLFWETWEQPLHWHSFFFF